MFTMILRYKYLWFYLCFLPNLKTHLFDGNSPNRMRSNAILCTDQMKKKTFHHKTFPNFDAVCNEEYNETPYKSVPRIRMIDFRRALELFLSVNVFYSSL